MHARRDATHGSSTRAPSSRPSHRWLVRGPSEATGIRVAARVIALGSVTPAPSDRGSKEDRRSGGAGCFDVLGR